MGSEAGVRERIDSRKGGKHEGIMKSGSIDKYRVYRSGNGGPGPMEVGI